MAAQRKWRPSALQAAVLAAVAALDSQPDVAARDVATRTGQSTDGAAYTLRSLVNRGLVVAHNHDGDRWLGYRLTDAGWGLMDGAR